MDSPEPEKQLHKVIEDFDSDIFSEWLSPLFQDRFMVSC